MTAIARSPFPIRCVGMDSHTPMINSLGIVGWGVGGFEGGTATLGEPVSMLIPEVIGCRLTRQARAPASPRPISCCRSRKSLRKPQC